MIQITSEPISPQLVIDKVKKDCYGAIISFVGTVRDTTQGRKVSFLQIETRDENAEAKLDKIVSEVKEKWQIQDVAICRRTGKLGVGEIALAIAVASPHRQEAFQACQYVVDKIKQGEITTEKENYETGESPAESRKR